MFALSVCLLDGTVVPLQPGPAWTIADVKLQLEQMHNLPSLHEFKLCQGTHELVHNSLIEVEIQAVCTKSAAKAVLRLNELMTKWETYQNDEPSDEDKAAFGATVEVLEESNVDHSSCEQLLALLCGMRCNCDRDQRALIAKAFGRVCADPSTTCLQKLLQLEDDVAKWCALAEISSRFRDALSMNARVEIADKAAHAIQEWLNRHGDAPAMYLELRSLYHVLSQLGSGMQQYAHLLRFTNESDPLPLGLFFPARRMLARLASEHTTVQVGVEEADDDDRWEFSVELEEECENEDDTEEKAGIQDREELQNVSACSIHAEECTSMEDNKNKADMLEREDLQRAAELSIESERRRANADVAEALLRSKEQIMLPSCLLRTLGIVRFRLTRCARCPELSNTLRTSEKLVAQRKRVEGEGYDLQPEFGGGMWSFVPLTYDDFMLAELEPCDSIILMLPEDENAVHQTLKHIFPKDRRPKLKKESQLRDPQDATSNEVDCSEPAEVVFERTFLSIRIRPDVKEPYVAPSV